jgi:putative ABC transport system permease protein
MTGDRTLRWATRSYRAMLRLLRVGRAGDRSGEIAADAAALLREARPRGRAALLRTWCHLAADALITGARHDASQALRTLVRAPGSTAAIALVLVLGIAATTTLFALVDAVLLRPLPYPHAERLVTVWESSSSLDRTREGPSPANALDWAARNDAFDALSAWMTTSMTLRSGDEATPVTGVQITRGFFEVFGRAALLGRTFAPGDYDGASWNVANQFVGRNPILIVSHRLWTQQLGRDPAVIGKTIHVEGREWIVVGVMPADFAVPDTEVGFWTPWDMSTSYTGARFPNGPPRDFRFLRVAGRLKDSVSLPQAASRMEALAARLAGEHPQMNAAWSVRLVPLHDEVVGGTRAELLVLFGAVFCLLILVCSNVSSLAVAGATMRMRELGIRMALGAPRARIVRQLLAETALLAVVSAAGAVLLTAWWIDAVVAFAPADVPRLHEVRVDGRVAGFAAALALIVSAIAGIVPAVQGGRAPVFASLQEGGPAGSRRSSVVRRGLVAAELAAALMLLVGAGLLVRSFIALRQVNPGFDRSNLLVLRITPDAARYRTGAQAADYYRRVLESLRSVPAIGAAAAVTVLPMSTVGVDFDRPYWREGARPPGDSAPEADIRMATPGYFATLRLPLVAGREFTDRDAAGAPRVVVVNESLARRTWPGEDAVGRSLILDYQRGAYPYEVVGVARDARYYGLRSTPRPEIFIPHAQNPYLVMNVVARTAVDPMAVAQTARAKALGVDPDQPVHSITTMDALIGETLSQDRFTMLLLSLFAAAGVLVAATGVYALLAHSVAQRRREIAVRMAVGASPPSVARLVLGESLALAGVGGVLGLAGAMLASRLAESLLFEIAPHDPVTLAATVALLAVIVVAASYLPARRATRIDPVSLMKS